MHVGRFFCFFPTAANCTFRNIQQPQEEEQEEEEEQEQQQQQQQQQQQTQAGNLKWFQIRLVHIIVGTSIVLNKVGLKGAIHALFVSSRGMSA